ncbi:hypothetical protein SP15_180 [Bacillus phage SP-15]|uniref:Uncharacterized protein n=1 Tax=Bacillus phage SP-15 TaxID=1792032 RepID=A0A127AWE3_9CAUD|nr:hypothetical protein SP15_180 [Bacillus phage SP-15]AMM44978.1 hypothetical protein SP15_180 [Bacillus phage SP-15]
MLTTTVFIASVSIPTVHLIRKEIKYRKSQRKLKDLSRCIDEAYDQVVNGQSSDIWTALKVEIDNTILDNPKLYGAKSVVTTPAVNIR